MSLMNCFLLYSKVSCYLMEGGMRNKRNLLIGMVLICFSSLTVSVSTSAQNTITWGWHNRPPYLNANASGSELGSIDKALELLISKLPMYEHKKVKAPIARVLKELEKGNHWCAAGLLKSPERDRISIASIPMFLIPGHRLMVRQDYAHELDSEGIVSLKKLISTPGVKIYFERERSYNGTIDTLIAAHPELKTFTSASQGVNMLLLDRIDYLLEHEATANYYATIEGKPDSLISIPFQEMSATISLRVLCPKNEWGKTVVADINNALNKIRQTSEYSSLFELYLSKKSVAELKEAYKTHFLNSN